MHKPYKSVVPAKLQDLQPSPSFTKSSIEQFSISMSPDFSLSAPILHTFSILGSILLQLKVKAWSYLLGRPYVDMPWPWQKKASFKIRFKHAFFQFFPDFCSTMFWVVAWAQVLVEFLSLRHGMLFGWLLRYFSCCCPSWSFDFFEHEARMRKFWGTEVSSPLPPPSPPPTHVPPL